MRLRTCLFVLICSLITAGPASAQAATEATPHLSTGPRQDAVSGILKNPFAQAQLPFDPDESDSPFIQGKARHLTLRHMVAGVTTKGNDGRAKGEEIVARAEGMPVFQRSFTLLGATFPFRMIGTDPAEGSQTTTISVTIVPLQLSFPDGSQLSASQIACGDTQSAAARVMQSPLFNNFPFTVGSTFVGNTQFMDAFQRANFWTDVTTKSPDYHVLLAPTLAPTVAIVPNPGFARTAHGPCAEIAAVDIGDFDSRIQSLIATMKIPPDTLPVFITYNTFLTENGGCCILAGRGESLARPASSPC